MRPIDAKLRVAIVSTPRSGNTWLRRLLASAFDLEELAVHSPADVEWECLPPRFVLQLHWPPTEPFLELLGAHKFRVVVLARHPLDVLISILHFAPREPQTARWLDGRAGNETAIAEATPTSPAFLDYGTGPRARTLLDVSREWWHAPIAHRIRYEDLVLDPAVELRRLGAFFDCQAASERIIGAVAANSIDALRRTSTNDHFWRGRVGNWRSVLPAARARLIAKAQQASFEDLGYVCDPDEDLDDARANANWIQ